MTPSLRDLRERLDLFAETVGLPLTETQLAALTLDRRITVLVAPRQSGKSRSLAVLATWRAFREKGHRVLVVSAGEGASKRLLSTVRTITAHPLLSSSVEDEGFALVRLSNGSEIRSVPSSERQVRGWTVDTLLADEAAMIDADLLLSAALPTTAARPDARIVLASTPWATEGPFFDMAMQGMDGGTEHLRTVRWSLADAPWITPSVLAMARETLGDLRFRTEYLAEFLGRVNAYLDPVDILGCVADYGFTPPAKANGQSIVLGCDWGGGSRDPHAVVGIGVANDHGANDAPVLFLPLIDTAHRPYGEQLDMIARLGMLNGRGYDVAELRTEANGVGSMPSQVLAAHFGPRRVESVYSSQRSKEDGYGKVRAWLADRRIVLPNHPELLRQLRGLTYEATPSGGLSIAAAHAGLHDDAADALYLAALAVPMAFTGDATSEPQGGIEWVATPAGVRLPRHPMPRHNALRGHGAGTFRRWSAADIHH